MSQNSQRERLEFLMVKHGLRCKDVAKILNRSLSLVRKWSGGFAPIKKVYIDVLEERLEGES